MGSLGDIRKPGLLDWIKQPGDAKPVNDVILTTPDMPFKDDKDKKDVKEKKNIINVVEINDSNDDIDVLVTYRINRDIVDRLYSEMFWDPRRRAMKDVVSEILQEGLKGRPFKGPAPPEFIAALKSRGKRKKS